MKVNQRWLNVDGYIDICKNKNLTKVQKNLATLDYISYATGVFYYNEGEKKICFRPDRPDLEYSNYKYSTDVINSDDPYRQREDFKSLLIAMEREEYIVKMVLMYLNMYLEEWDDRVAKVLLDRYLLKKTTRAIMKDRKLYTDQYYKYFRIAKYYAGYFIV